MHQSGLCLVALSGVDFSIQPGPTPVATIIREIDPPLSGTVRTAAVVAGLVLDVAKAAPLPEAKPNDVGFSQQVWPGWTISSPARPQLNVCPARWSPSHATISSSTTKIYDQLDSTKDTPIPLDAVFALASMTKPMAAVTGLMLLG
jgi:hypothetical protein